MKITVAGAGNGGSTIAADLKRKGHTVTLLKTSSSLHNEHFNKVKQNGEITIVENGRETVVHLDHVITDFKQAISDAELIIIYVQTNYHEQVIKKMKPYLNENQVVLLEPGYLSTAYLLKHCKGKLPIIVEAESSPIDCRIVAPGKVKVLFRNVRNPVCIYAEGNHKDIQAKLDTLDYHFVYLDSVVEAALHNPNLIVHTIGGIMSIPRIEYSHGDYWMYKEVFTPHVWQMVESLDDEKMMVLEKIGAKRVSYVDACSFRNEENLDIDSKQAFLDYAANNSPAGPSIAESRFITEDVPEGLVLLESLGEMLAIPTPTCTGLINIATASLGVDFREKGRTVETLGMDYLNQIIGKAIPV